MFPQQEFRFMSNGNGNHEQPEFMTPMPAADVAQLALIRAMDALAHNMNSTSENVKELSSSVKELKDEVGGIKITMAEQRGMAKLATAIKDFGPVLVAIVLALFIIFSKK